MGYKRNIEYLAELRNSKLDNSNENQGTQPDRSTEPPATRGAEPQGGSSKSRYTPGPYNPQGQGSVTHHDRDRQRTYFALLLIGAGVLFLLQQFSIFRDFGDYLLLIIGAVFMYAYFSTREGYRAGFLIPGAILLGIGTGQLLQKLDVLNLWNGADLSGLTLGLGFCLIWALERKHWWALIPGGILVVSSLSDVLMVGRLWPLGLILLGVYLLYEQTRRNR